MSDPFARLVLTAALVLIVTGSGCVTVKPYQRGHLASPAMNPQFGDGELSVQYRAKVLESRTGGGLPGTAPGGGCGCTQ